MHNVLQSKGVGGDGRPSVRFVCCKLYSSFITNGLSPIDRRPSRGLVSTAPDRFEPCAVCRGGLKPRTGMVLYSWERKVEDTTVCVPPLRST